MGAAGSRQESRRFPIIPRVAWGLLWSSIVIEARRRLFP